MEKFNSSHLRLEVGAKVHSIAAYRAWFQANREQLKNEAMDGIYTSLESKAAQRVRKQMEADGVLFVEHARPDYAAAPEAWEIENWDTKPEMAGKVLVTIRKARDAHSYERLHVFEADLHANYTGKTLQELIDYDLESVKSRWTKKAEHIRAADQQKRTTQLVESSTDELAKAAHVVAEFETASNSQRAEMMADTAYRSRLLAAKAAVSAARSFK
jgi:hypothetical protein